MPGQHECHQSDPLGSPVLKQLGGVRPIKVHPLIKEGICKELPSRGALDVESRACPHMMKQEHVEVEGMRSMSMMMSRGARTA